MAVRFSADGQDFTRSVALGSQTAFTVSCWVYLSVDRNDYSSLWSLDNGTGDMELCQTDADGTTLKYYPDYDAGTILSLTVGSWVFLAVAGATTGNTRTAYYRTPGQSTLTTVTLGSATATNMATLRFGESAFGAEWGNLRLAAVKAHIGATLTPGEVFAESTQIAPARTANLTFWYPFDRPDPLDYSGNGHTLTGGSGTAYEDGPPIPRQRILVRPYLFQAVTGGPTPVSATDTATVSETASVTAVATGTDTAAVGDTAATLAATSVTDAAGVSESLAVLVGVTATDTGTASDTGSTSAAVSATDTAGVADTAGSAATASVSDSATHTDAAALLAATGLTDTATSADTAATSANLSAADSLVATDLAAVAAALGGTGAGAVTDASSLGAGSANKADSDTSPLPDAAAITAATVGVSDPATQSDAGAVTSHTPGADTATLGESVTLLVVIAASDT